MKTVRNLLALNLLLVTTSLRASPPNLDASLAPGANRLNLRWESVPGQVQQIQVSTDLLHWTNLPPLFVSAFTDSAWTDDGSLTGGLVDARSSLFYRLLLPQTAGASVGVPL